MDAPSEGFEPKTEAHTDLLETLDAINLAAEFVKEELARSPELMIPIASKPQASAAQPKEENTPEDARTPTAEQQVDVSRVKSEYQKALRDEQVLKAILNAQTQLRVTSNEKETSPKAPPAKEVSDGFAPENPQKVEMQLKKGSRFKRTQDTRPVVRGQPSDDNPTGR